MESLVGLPQKSFLRSVSLRMNSAIESFIRTLHEGAELACSCAGLALYLSHFRRRRSASSLPQTPRQQDDAPRFQFTASLFSLGDEE